MDANATWASSLAADLLPALCLPDLRALAAFFYIVDPDDYKDVTQPNLFSQSWPYLLVLILMEQVVLRIQGRAPARLNDTLTSLSLGLLQESGRVLWRGGETCLYAWLHSTFKAVDVDWTHPAAFYVAALLVDFCYYWVHRACHEVHILWAQHQVHHSSEEMNMAVGARQSIIQGWCALLFYLPLSPLLPPHQLLLHQQVSLLYQLWLHTETVGSLGPLEYLFNTPTHHRVHHGCNKYCLDKNYGGFLIIWDRLFGTFAEEEDREKIVYGLVFNQPSFNPLHLQTFYSRHVWSRLQEAKGWRQKMAAVFFGPSWTPGAPRLGWDHDKIDVQPREKYDVKLPMWLNAYVVLQFLLAAGKWGAARGAAGGTLWALQTLWTLTAIGLLLDGSKWGPLLEGARSALAAATAPSAAPCAAAAVSALCWLAVAAGAVRLRLRLPSPSIESSALQPPINAPTYRPTDIEPTKTQPVF